MAVKIVISPEAQEEFDVLECQFRAKTNGLKTFIEDFENQLQILYQIPSGFQIRYRNVRIIHFEKSDYSIHYVFKNNIVYIIRVLHQRQEY